MWLYNFSPVKINVDSFLFCESNRRSRRDEQKEKKTYFVAVLPLLSANMFVILEKLVANSSNETPKGLYKQEREYIAQPTI